jgi:hypothetical protein
MINPYGEVKMSHQVFDTMKQCIERKADVMSLIGRSKTNYKAVCMKKSQYK